MRLLIRSVQGIDCNNSIRLVRKKARRVVNVNYCRSRVDALCAIGWKECYPLVLPMIEVMGRSMSPMLISSYRSVRVVCESQYVVEAGDGTSHTDSRGDKGLRRPETCRLDRS